MAGRGAGEKKGEGGVMIEMRFRVQDSYNRGQYCAHFQNE